jgi:hypothetical protein
VLITIHYKEGRNMHVNNTGFSLGSNDKLKDIPGIMGISLYSHYFSGSVAAVPTGNGLMKTGTKLYWTCKISGI